MKINQRLFDHYGIDTNKDLKIEKRCPRPFDTILIDKQGSCFACECQSWLPQSIGNLQIKPLSEIIDSVMHKHLKSSINDGSYRYCNNKQCSWLIAEDFKEFGSQDQRPSISYLRLAIDDSCNLRCPSCRDKLIFHKEGSAFQLGVKLADRVNQWLSDYHHPINVHIGSDGDPFASHVYRHFMQNVPDHDGINFSIMTNGLMFEEVQTRIPKVISRVRKLEVSIDGATRDTYESLRLGGKWDNLLQNLRSMYALKQKHGFTWNWHMVVQEKNWREIPSMMAMAHRYGVDRVYFNRIRDWGTSLDISLQSFHKQEEFKKMRAKLFEDMVANPYGLL